MNPLPGPRLVERRKRGSVRKSLALTLSAGLLLALSACSGSPAAPDCSQAAPSGEASSLVTATGELGASDPGAAFPYPLVVDTAERSVLIQGDGEPVGQGGTLVTSYTVYDGETGAAVSPAQNGAIVLSDALPAGLQSGLLCAATGDRIVTVLPKDDATAVFPNATGSIVMVFDVTAAFPRASGGAAQAAPAGFPGVVHDQDGRPGISITGTAPTEAKAAVLKTGDGAELAEGDTVVVQSTGVSYTTKKVTTSTWEQGSPLAWTLTADDSTPSSGSTLPPGMSQFLIGQTVGSEVLVVLPDGNDSATAYVVDILGILPPN